MVESSPVSCGPRIGRVFIANPHRSRAVCVSKRWKAGGNPAMTPEKGSDVTATHPDPISDIGMITVAAGTGKKTLHKSFRNLPGILIRSDFPTITLLPSTGRI